MKTADSNAEHNQRKLKSRAT